MIILNSLKVLSSEIRHTLSITYKPRYSIQKAFILPKSISVQVEIFPMSKVGVFAQADPLYAIDGYIKNKFGQLHITPCTSEGFVDPNWADLVAANEKASFSKVSACVEENIGLLVESAICKSEKAQFTVNNIVGLKLIVFLVKINQLEDALRCIKENMPTSYSLSSVLPYILYETLITVLLDPKNPSVLNRIAYISTALDSKLSSIEEDRALNAVLKGLQHSAVPRTPNILNMYSRISIAPHKESIFYYLLSLCIGTAYTAKYALVGLAMNSPKCQTCKSLRRANVNKTLQSIISQESNLTVKCTPYDLTLGKYIHSKGAVPDPEISMYTGIGKYVTQKEKEIESTSTVDMYSIESIRQDAGEESSAFTVYTEGLIALHAKSSDVEVTGILLQRLPSDTVVVTGKELCVAHKSVQYLPPIYSQANKYSFFISTTCNLIEVYLKHRDRTYSKKVHVLVEVLEVPLSKKIASHRLGLVLGASSSEKQDIEQQLQKITKSSFSVVAQSPLHVRVPFLYNSQMLYTEIWFNWEHMPVIKIKETENTYEIQATCKDVTVKHAKTSVEIKASTTKIVRKESAAKVIRWSFNDKSKKGKVFL